MKTVLSGKIGGTKHKECCECKLLYAAT